MFLIALAQKLTSKHQLFLFITTTLFSLIGNYQQLKHRIQNSESTGFKKTIEDYKLKIK
jgi:hypothetical protein